MPNPPSITPHIPPSQGTIYVPRTGSNTSVRINVPINGSTTPTIQQSVRPQPLNDIKSEWTRSMVHMQGNLDNMNNLLSELKVLLGQLKILLGDQAPTGFNEIIQVVDSTKDSRDKLAVEVFKLQNTFSRFDADAVRGIPGASEILDKTTKVLEEFTKGTLASSQPVTSGNTQGRPNAVSQSQQSSEANPGVTNSPFVFTPLAPPISGVGTQTTTANTASTQTSGASTNASTSSTTTAQTSNASTQTLASNTASNTLPPSSTNSSTSNAATNTANTQTSGASTTSTTVPGKPALATGNASGGSKESSASQTIRANSSGNAKFHVYDNSDQADKNIINNHKKSIQFLKNKVKDDFSFNLIGINTKERNNLIFVLNNEANVEGSEMKKDQLVAINNFTNGEIIPSGQEALLRLVLRNRIVRLSKEIENLSSN